MDFGNEHTLKIFPLICIFKYAILYTGGIIMSISAPLRLFHVSEESNISVFHPRIPLRKDMDTSVPLVWAISENRLANFMTPRDCPRVCFHKTDKTAEIDLSFFSSPNMQSVVAIESAWFDQMKNIKLYLYEFNPENFELQDECAGYYVSKKSETPISVIAVDDVFSLLFKYKAEIRIVDNLWPLAEKVMKTTLDWSLCRMKNAIPHP